MSNTGSHRAHAAPAPSHASGFHGLHNQPEASALYAANGARKYLNAAERSRILSVVQALPADQLLFISVLAWSGGRISEILALTPASFQLDSGIVTLRTLKRRRLIFREIPLPPELMDLLDRRFGIAAMQRAGEGTDRRLWPWSRTTAWRIVKTVMASAGIAGRQACPRGLRHGYAVAALSAGIPLNLLQRWLGHSRLTTTAIYAGVIGPEELALAALFWKAAA